MNIVEAFAEYLASTVGATLGHDLFISRAPASNSNSQDGDAIPDNLWWIVAGGGVAVSGSQSRRMRSYTINVYYRDRKAENVYNKLQSLSDAMTCDGCLSLAGYDVIDARETGLWSDQDLDDENRSVGLLQVTITTFKSGVS